MPSLNSSSSSSAIPKALSTHTSDPMLAPFLTPAFSPAAYLNSALPILATTSFSSASTAPPAKALPLPELTTAAQQHVAQLAAHAARLATTLTALTDDLLRGGGARLAYDVEVLRGEARALAEVLAPGAGPGMERFGGGCVVEEGEEDDEEDDEGEDDDEEEKEEEEEAGETVKKDKMEKARRRRAKEREETVPGERTKKRKNQAEKEDAATPLPSDPPPDDPLEPAALARLRTLHRVRTRLQSVIATFNAALLFPFPPSQLSATPPPLPSLAVATSSSSSSAVSPHESAGQAALRAIRADIDAALTARGPDADTEIEGVRRAEARVAELKALCAVWKGTGEERARGRWVEGLARAVEERRRGLEGGKGAVR